MITSATKEADSFFAAASVLATARLGLEGRLLVVQLGLGYDGFAPMKLGGAVSVVGRKL